MPATSQPHHRSPSPELVSAVAHHEAAHALAIMLAFRHAPWLPAKAPALAVRYVEIAPEACCVGLDIFSRRRWSDNKHDQRYRDLMQRQIVIHLAGGVGEAIHRGERRRAEVLAFVNLHCEADADLQRAAGVLDDLRQLTGFADQQFFAERTLALMLTHWSAVTAVASALLARRRIEGAEVTENPSRALSGLLGTPPDWSAEGEMRTNPLGACNGTGAAQEGTAPDLPLL